MGTKDTKKKISNVGEYIILERKLEFDNISLLLRRFLIYSFCNIIYFCAIC
jgi:hypothetical protein